MSAPYAFTPNELLTLCIAAYAAIISTFVLGWDAYKWLAAGPRLVLEVSADMTVIGGHSSPDKKVISLTAHNIGDQPTTIVNVGGMHFRNWWGAYITRRSAHAFVAIQPSMTQPLPYRFEIGDQWIGLIDQEQEIVEWARTGYLFFIVFTSGGRKYRARLVPRSKGTA